MSRFILVFIISLLAFTFFISLESIREWAIYPWNEVMAWLSYASIAWWDGFAAQNGTMLTDTQSGFSVVIQSGCNGVEPTVILMAAILAFPAGSVEKLLGICVGVLTIQALNIARIVSLFYLGQWNEDWFHWIHTYLWPLIIILDAFIVYLLWIRLISRETQMPPAQ